MSEPLPKQELLIKIMGMTTASNDGEALAALRRANSMLESAGWSWEKLIRGKITVVEDPFARIADPAMNGGTIKERQPAPPQYKPPVAPDVFTVKVNVGGGGGGSVAWSAIIKGVSINRFPGFCYACAKEVLAGNGLIFKPRDHNQHGGSNWAIVCHDCDGKRVCASGPALVTKTRKKSVGDLA